MTEYARETVDESVVTLLHMLTTKRPGGSKSERKFIKRFLKPLGVTADAFGNRILRIGDAPIMWSCHTDTVHSSGGTQKIKSVGKNWVGLDPISKSNCLGADDTAGVWLMCELIKAQVPGLYVFHREEESGGLGSRWIAKETPELLKGIKFAVALDRKGRDEVITHQMGRCCSDEFAVSLAAQLGMGYKPSDEGLFTDTANYTDLIGECTNLSVGYKGHHTNNEVLNVNHLRGLRDKLIKLDVNALVSKRMPGEIDPKDYVYSFPYNGHAHYVHSGTPSAPVESKGREYDIDNLYPDEDQEPKGRYPTYPLSTLVRNHPDEIADLLEDYGMDALEIEREIQERIGYLRGFPPR